MALKLLPAERFASAEARARFEREVKLAARLEHASIARVYDSGLHDGVYYYAMELISGCGLNEIISQNRVRQEADTATVDLAETVPLPRAAAADTPGEG